MTIFYRLLLVSLLSGCSVSVEEFQAAKIACDPHGGINFLTPHASTTKFVVRCKNGTDITGAVPK